MLRRSELNERRNVIEISLSEPLSTYAHTMHASSGWVYRASVTKRSPLSIFLNHLPKLSSAVKCERPSDSFEVAPSVPIGYVWPDLLMDDDGPPTVPVVLVTAAGAMGKSIAARAVAASLNAPLIDLSKLHVGSDSLTGLLTNVLGWTAASEYVSAVEAGTGSMVMDGLDEAQLAAGREHFLAFMRNVADLVKRGNPRGQVVIFGRRDAIDTAHLALAEVDVQSAICHVAPLTHHQASLLIENTLDTKQLNGVPYEVHRVHKVPHRDLKDGIFIDMAHALGVTGSDIRRIWPFVDDFLGYPPVLLVLSEHLLVENPHSEISRRTIVSSSVSEKAQRAEILRTIVEGILDREANKVRMQLEEALALPTELVSLLYQRDEQIVRLIDYIAFAQSDIVPPASLPPEVRQRYDMHIGTFLPDHPFIVGRMFANTVFADYARAFVRTSPLTELLGVKTSVLSSACQPPGPFFAYFLHAMAEPGNDAKAASVTESDLNDLISSHIAGCTDDAAVAIYGTDDGYQMELIEERSGLPLSVLPFQLKEPSGVIELESPVSRCTVVSTHAVCILARNDEVQIGPGAFIVTDELTIYGKRLAVVAKQDEPIGAVLYARRKLDHDPGLAVKVHTSKDLMVGAPDLGYQFRPYGAKAGGLGTSYKLRLEVILAARRVLRAFHQGKTGPSVHSEKLINIVVGGNRTVQATMRGLEDLKVIVNADGVHLLKLDVLAKYKISWTAINGTEFMSALQPLISALWETDGIKALLPGASEEG